MGHELHADERIRSIDSYTPDSSPLEAIDREKIPEEYRPRTYGEKLIRPVRLGDLIMLTQTRSEANPESQNLGDSIERNGLINQLDVARMPVDALEEYVDFVNRIWGADHDVSQLPVAQDGYHYLVIAGHSRTLGIMENEANRAKRALDAGYETDPDEAVIHCKIVEAPTPSRIIALQLEENIHHQVPRERQAMCIVETYLYGLETGAWSNQTEFVTEADGRFSKDLLRNALHFSRLPESAREQVMLGALRYSTAVELAKTYPELVQYCLFEYFDERDLNDLSEEESAGLFSYCEEWLGREIAEIQDKRIGVAAAKKRMESYRENWVETMGADRESQPTLFMRDPNEDFKLEKARQRREYRSIVRRLADKPLQQVARAIAIHDQLAFDDKESRSAIETSSASYTQALGGTAIGRGLTAES